MSVQRYRLIVVDVEAIQVSASNAQLAATWCGGVEVEEIDCDDSTKRFKGVNVPTLFGVQRASDKDYIVRSREGNFRVMKQGEFEAMYELAP